MTEDMSNRHRHLGIVTASERWPVIDHRIIVIKLIRFGELVDRNIVVRSDDGYRLSDPDSMRLALDTDRSSKSSRDDVGGIDFPRFDWSLTMGRGVLLGVLIIVGIFPIHSALLNPQTASG